MKRRLLLFLATVLPMFANAYDACIDGIYYKFSGTNAIVTCQEYEHRIISDYSGDVVIPESVSYNGRTYNVTGIGNGAFHGCTGLTSVSIPNSVTSIGDYTFQGCSSLTDVYCFAKNTPSTSNNPFENSAYATLHVPATAIEDYKSKSPWNRFREIVALTEEETAIKDIENEQGTMSNEVDTIYDINGKLLSQPKRGINIIHTSNDKTRKVLVK